MADKKVFVGSGKKKSDTWFKVTINPEKLKDYIQHYEGKPFVKLDINIKDQPDHYGKDVSITIDTWEPDRNRTSSTSQSRPVDNCPQPEADDSDELPF